MGRLGVHRFRGAMSLLGRAEWDASAKRQEQENKAAWSRVLHEAGPLRHGPVLAELRARCEATALGLPRVAAGLLEDMRAGRWPHVGRVGDRWWCWGCSSWQCTTRRCRDCWADAP